MFPFLQSMVRLMLKTEVKNVNSLNFCTFQNLSSAAPLTQSNEWSLLITPFTLGCDEYIYWDLFLLYHKQNWILFANSFSKLLFFISGLSSLIMSQISEIYMSLPLLTILVIRCSFNCLFIFYQILFENIAWKTVSLIKQIN